MLLRAVDHPEQLPHDLLARRRRRATPGELLEDPGIAERAARHHHGVRARLGVGGAGAIGAAQAARDDDRHLDEPGQLAHQRVVGASAVLDRRRPRVEGDRGDARVGEANRQLEAGAISGLEPGADLDRDGPAGALDRGARDGDREVGIVDQRRPRPGPRDLAHGAAHVDVDQVGPSVRRDAGAGAHHVWVVPEELDRHRMLLGMNDQELLERAAVAVMKREARDHLRDREPGAVAARLKAHEPVADPGQRGEKDAVGDLDVRDPERSCQRRLAHLAGPSDSARRSGGAPSM